MLVKAFKQYRSPHQNALPRSMPPNLHSQMAMSSSFCTLLFIYWWKAIRDQINRIQSTFTNLQIHKYHFSNLTIQNMQAKNYWKRIRHAPDIHLSVNTSFPYCLSWDLDPPPPLSATKLLQFSLPLRKLSCVYGDSTGKKRNGGRSDSCQVQL